MEPVVRAEALVKQFGELRAVDDISFEVRRGECFGMLGPNGAGKTTTIRMLYGFSPFTAGCLTLFGLPVPEEVRRVKARLGVCQQEDSLDPDLTVEDNLVVFGRYFDLPPARVKARAAELLDFIGLAHRRKARIPELSGGMKRRLMLARALINDPELLILDEPTTGLDPQSRHQVWNRLEELRSRGLSILLTTHYMDEAARLCDRLVIMDRGRILVEGSPASLIRRHVGSDVLELTDPGEELRALVLREKLPHEDLGHRLVVYWEERGELFERLSRDYCGPGCTLRMATLEDVFLRLTGRELRE